MGSFRQACLVRKTRLGRQTSLGFTLIEALLATLLMSLLMLTGAYAYDYVTQNWQRHQMAYQQALNHYRTWQLVHEVVSDTLPKLVYASDPDARVSASSVPSQAFYFLGRENGFTAVSAQSLQKPDYPAVYRLFREPDPQQLGAWQLVYEEAVIEQSAVRHAQQELPFSWRSVLVSGLPDIRFQYHGWQTVQARINYHNDPVAPQNQPSWSSRYDGIETFQHPLRVSVLLGEQSWVVEMPDNYGQVSSQTNSGV